MLLYHGSNVRITEISLGKSREDIDFGKGFYLTSSLEQAQRFAENIVKRRVSAGETSNNSPIVSQFEWDEVVDNLNAKVFDGADREWLDYVSLNRQMRCENDFLDIVIGPVANDQTTPVILDYLASDRTDDDVTIALIRLKHQKLVDQYVFKSDKAIKHLKPQGVVGND